MSKVQEGSTVKVHYTGKLNSGEVFDSSREREPLEFTVGKRQLIEGFENGVVGMEVNETKEVNIPADKAYGQKRDDLVQKVPKNMMPQDADIQVGSQLVSVTEGGQEIMVTVIEMGDDHVVVDGNHPLAGKDLVFEIEVMEID